MANHKPTHETTTDVISIADLLALPKPAHWPRSSYYCVRSALRRVSTKIPRHERFPVRDLPKILYSLITGGCHLSPGVWSLLTYRARILRLAAEHACNRPLGPWEARWFFLHVHRTPSSFCIAF